MGIPKGHRFWGVNHGVDEELSDIGDNVHGGFTYSAGGADGYWYFGFDTTHADDFAPKMVEHNLAMGIGKYEFSDCMKYKTWEFVEGEIHWLGKRLWQYNEYDIGFKEDADV